VIGILIFVHELGHFLAAKKLGIRVERFSIGFGPKMVGFTRGDTEYRISWLPFLGGYVKMAGENPAERPDGDTEETEEEKAGRFDTAPVLHRMIIAIAGPGMNIILAVFAVALAYMVGMPDHLVPHQDTTIGYVYADSPASKAGVMPGDKILAIDGYKTRVWNDIRESVAIRPDEEIEITILRNEDEETIIRAIPERIEPLSLIIESVVSIRLAFQSDLDRENIPRELEEEFEKSGVSLSSDAFISIEKIGSEWLITDPGEKWPKWLSWIIASKDKRYVVRREENRLDIYREIGSGKIDLAFSVNLDFESDLDNSIISENLRQRLEDREILLSSDANLFIEETGSRWVIVDKDERYSVKKEKDRLDIHLETEFQRFQDNLDNGTISESLRHRFADSGISLSSDAAVSVEKTGSEWLITDPGKRWPQWLSWLIASKDSKYIVNKEESRLYVYQETEFGKIGIAAVTKPIIGDVEQGSVAEHAGFRPDDLIVAVDQKEVGHIIEFADEIQGVSGESVNLTVERAGDTLEIPFALEREDGQVMSLGGLSFGKIVRMNPISAFGMAVPETIRMGGKIFQFLKRLIVGDVPRKYVAGPIGIVQLTMVVIKSGLGSTLNFAGFLSVNLGIVNLLPLFITDGGMIVFLIIEGLRGKPMNRKKQLIIQQIGIGFIMLIFLFVTYNDILRLIRGAF
jgi:membrane-associated protease RseP (regulator of RpoE activity)